MDFLLHIGLPKTASTYVQKEIWPFVSNTIYLGKKFDENQVHHGKTVEWCNELRYKILNSPPTTWMGREGGWLLGKLKNVYEERSGVNNIVLSHEELFGRATNGIFIDSTEPLDVERMVSHLYYMKEALPVEFNIRVLIVIRRQDTWLSSAYSQCSTNIDRANQKDFIDKTDKLIKKELYQKAAFLDYSFLLERLNESIGSDNVYTALFEELKMNNEKFVKNLLAKIDGNLRKNVTTDNKNTGSIGKNEWRITPNSTLKKLYRMIAPKSIKSRVNNIRAKRKILLGDESISLSEELSNKVLEKFRESNKKLEYRHGLEVSKYGYVK